MLSKIFGNKNKTFRPVSHTDAKRTQMSQKIASDFAKATLGTGDLASAVQLPKGEDQNEWLAVNTVDFFNEISLLYGTISDFCTRESCPRMTAGEEYEYLWMDGVKYKKPTEVSAPEYVELLMAWVEAQINDEQIFPLQLGTPFPKDFMSRVKKIFQRLFRVYAHVYLSHVDRVSELGAGAHLNTCFKHFIFFVKEFKLIEEPQLEPLKEHITQLTKPQDASK